MLFEYVFNCWWHLALFKISVMYIVLHFIYFLICFCIYSDINKKHLLTFTLCSLSTEQVTHSLISLKVRTVFAMLKSFLLQLMSIYERQNYNWRTPENTQ